MLLDACVVIRAVEDDSCSGLYHVHCREIGQRRQVVQARSLLFSFLESSMLAVSRVRGMVLLSIGTPENKATNLWKLPN